MKRYVGGRILFVLALLTLPGIALADLLTTSPIAQVVPLGNPASADVVVTGGFVGDYDLVVSWDPGILSFTSLVYSGNLGFSVQATTPAASSVEALEVSLESVANLMTIQNGVSVNLFTLNFGTIGLFHSGTE